MDITGQRFGRLVAIAPTGERKSKEIIWLCQCDCGNTHKAVAGTLHRGLLKSCGCLKTRHGKCNTRLYKIYHDMKSRCYNRNIKNYPLYGGRGIAICEEWLDNFQTFYEWAISNRYTNELTIERIDPNGNYEPLNCRWATKNEQNINQRRTIHAEINGVTHVLSEWSKIVKIPARTLYSRYDQGLRGTELIAPPKKVGKNVKEPFRKRKFRNGTKGIASAPIPQA